MDEKEYKSKASWVKMQVETNNKKYEKNFISLIL
tara:strand:+ start:118 stop:219 length:102 start_codon:yes stop_codon:yes gene_type:complete